MTGESILLRQDQAGIATLTLNRPKALNSLSLGLIQALRKELVAVHNDPQVRVVIIAGAGNVFCAGHDLKEIKDAEYKNQYTTELFTECALLMQEIVKLPKPVIARVQGVATAAGTQLVASCDLAIAEVGAKFATPGVNIGLFCSTPMVALSRNVSPKHAMQMLLTGDLIDAQEALNFGLVNEVVPISELENRSLKLAEQIASKSALTLAIGKEAFYRQLEMPLSQAYSYTRGVMIKNLESKDAQEGINAFIDKRVPTWCGQ
jgi:enoyl-CoA hydratase/carnithine racemase